MRAAQPAVEYLQQVWVEASAFVLTLRLMFLLMLHHPEWVKRLHVGARFGGL
jgi:hypothetical protein